MRVDARGDHLLQRQRFIEPAVERLALAGSTVTPSIDWRTSTASVMAATGMRDTKLVAPADPARRHGGLHALGKRPTVERVPT